MVRESVGNALKRVKEESLGSVVLECKSSTVWCSSLQHHMNDISDNSLIILLS